MLAIVYHWNSQVNFEIEIGEFYEFEDRRYNKWSGDDSSYFFLVSYPELDTGSLALGLREKINHHSKSTHQQMVWFLFFSKLFYLSKDDQRNWSRISIYSSNEVGESF